MIAAVTLSPKRAVSQTGLEEIPKSSLTRRSEAIWIIPYNWPGCSRIVQYISS
jgi:hypothetical protein